MFRNFLKWLLEILVPFLALVLGLLFLRISRRHQLATDKLRYQDKLETAHDIGYDACILGVGMAIVFVGGSEFQASVQTELAILLPLVIGLVLIVVLVLFGTSKYSDFVKAVMSIITGSAVFGANTAIRSWLSEHNVTRMITLGVAAWFVSSTIFLSIIFKIKKDQTNEEAAKAKTPQQGAVTAEPEPDEKLSS